ncbi:MAG: FtsX-like permease family protein [Emergencia sp.]|nr:FtsX-like permease family protein [Emergencia sp.]
MLKKSTFREIKSSLGRYLAILAIVALGVGFFSGLKVTRQAMIATAGNYLDANNFFDYQVMNSLGFEEEDVTAMAALKDVKNAEGSISCDVLYHTDNVKTDQVLKLHSLPENINTLTLKSGRMPKAANECIIDYNLLDEDPIGSVIHLSKDNEDDTLDMLTHDTYTVVGTCVSPIYLNFERGSTALGNGSVSGFAYLGDGGFDTDYYTEIYLSLVENFPIYTSAYKDLISRTEDAVQTQVDIQADRRYDAIVTEARKELTEAQKEYDKNYKKYQNEKADAQRELASTYQKLTDGRAEIAKNKENLNKQEKRLKDNQAKVEQGLAETAKKREEFEANKAYLPPEQAAQTEAQLSAAEKELQKNLKEIKTGFTQISEGRKKLSKSEKEIEDGFTAYYKGKAEADEKFAKADAEFKDARIELADAEKEIEDIETPDTYVLDRNTNIGYACFENDSGIIDGIAKIFPIFFFLVAALVCMTTMTRMIDEQRTQIGVMKALGYSNGAVIGKYMFYSGSAALIGCIIGFFSCCYIFPIIIWHAYGMMYDFSADLVYIVDKPLAASALAVSLLCSMGTTLFSCYAEFREVPAQLIRPKAPKNGKRILLERIPFLWNKLSFLYKVSFRNIFRYKKRFFMMVLGISGCTALLLTGLGVSDSVRNFADYQYDEIQVYDYSITFNKEMTETRQQRFSERNASSIDKLIYLHLSSADLVTEDAVKSVNLIAADSSDFGDFIRLHDNAGNPISYPSQKEAVICRKLANTYNLSPGSDFILRNKDGKEVHLTVSAVCENYVQNYIYISPKAVENDWGGLPEIKAALVYAASDSAADGSNADTGDNTAHIYSSSASVLNDSYVAAVSINHDFRIRVENMMESLDYVILLVILSAGALAFIVLYNLTNINITERIREIATIKVLGFYPGETSAYVFRENFFLTGISALVGLILGKVLHAFVMSQIQVDLICFDVRITPLSYVLAVILTFAFATIVSLAMYYKLEKISMTESLKSIE